MDTNSNIFNINLLTSNQIELKNKNDVKNRKIGLIVAGIVGGSGLLLSSICLPFVTPALRKVCLPYVPATSIQVQNVFKALNGKTGKLIDLGSGDGRIVIEGAKRGFKSEGVELNPWLVIYSKYMARKEGLTKLATFNRANIWNISLKEFENVIIFGVDSMMKDLEEKCKMELKSGTCIVACRFPMPTLVPIRTIGEGINTVWLYNITKENS